MTTYAELEMTLRRHAAEDAYEVEMSLRLPGSDAATSPLQKNTPALARFDLVGLETLAADPPAYGQLLSAGLFADEAVRIAFAQVLAAARAKPAALRWRLVIADDASELHNLRWETLCDPLDQTLLFTGEKVLFSRYLGSPSWQPVYLRPKGALSALAAAANPVNLAAFKLASVDVVGELRRAQTGLGNVPATLLPEKDQRVTLDNILARLRGGCDIVYLACHGSLNVIKLRIMFSQS